MFALLTSVFNIHLNLNQMLEIKSSSIEFSLEKLHSNSVSNRSNVLNEINETILVRVSFICNHREVKTNKRKF